MRVLLLVTGYPSSSDSQRGIFNMRSARRLAATVTMTIVHLRSWRPGLPFLEVERDGNLTIRRLSIPQFHLGARFADRTLHWNIQTLIHFGWLGARHLMPSHDVIHSVGAVSAASVGCDWSRRTGMAHVVQAIGDDVNTFLPQYANAGWINWHRRVDGVACNSHALQQKLLSLYPFLENIHTVCRGVDLKEFSPTGESSGNFAECPGVRFLFLGGFPFDRTYGRNPKGGQTLMAAWELADSKGIGTSAFLTIGGPNLDSSALQKWRAGLKHPESVQIAGAIPPTGVPNWLRGCDAVLIPSLVEGMPNLATEAAACGKPVIARPAGGLPEIVQHGRTGLLFESTEPQDWAEILLDSVRHSDKLKTMGNEARSYAEANLSSDRYPVAMVQIYEEALAMRNGRAVNLT
jgi:glycosyltransferase involved in cell wall biosynthesis